MRTLLEVKAAYDEVDALIQRRLAEAIASGDATLEAEWSFRKDATDYAYFVVIFAQLERIVKAKFVEARDRRRQNLDWTQRRLWDADVFSGEKIPFSTVLAAVLDRQSAPYRSVISYYQERNRIAHGGLTASVGSIDVFVQDISLIVAHLRA